MAAMVKTYLLLCVVGLCTTLFVILIMYGDDHARLDIQSQIRKIRPDKFGNSTGHHMILDPSKVQPVILAPANDKFMDGNLQPPDFTNRDTAESLTPHRLQGENKYYNARVGNEDVVNQIYMDAAARKVSPKTGADHVNDVFPPHAEMIDAFHKFQVGIQETKDKFQAGVKNAKDQVAKSLSKPKPVGPELPPVDTKLAQPLAADMAAANAQNLDTLSSCQPRNNIVLLKTHKCSSSTLQNILYRWGDDHDLSFVLPKGGMPYLGSPALFTKSFAIESADGVYNILANHARFSSTGIAEIMPPDTIYITILRNPTTQYESLYTYYRHQQRFGADLAHFLMNPNLYFVKEPMSTHIVGRNSMLFDLGLDARHMEANSDKVNAWIQMLDNKFSLVLIAEYFSECLILLKDLLCWSMDDIVYLNQNARSAGSVKHLTPSMQHGILKWNSADAKLYNHFNQTLWRKIKAYGYDRMKSAVQLLNSKNALLTADCVQSKLQSGDPRMWYPPGVKMESFRVNPLAKNKALCDKVTRPELTYMKQLADKQRRRNTNIEESAGIHQGWRLKRDLGRDMGHSNSRYRTHRKPPPGKHRAG